MNTEQEQEYKELARLAIEWADKTSSFVLSDGSVQLLAQINKFRPKPKRVGWIVQGNGEPVTKGVELDDEVRARLGPSGGVKREDVEKVAEYAGHWSPTRTDAIMQIIAAASVEVEDERT